jgi:hypothetical protein
MANLIARPSDAELLAWLDGDLPPGRRAEISRLLEVDWEVRAQLASLERCIEVYVRVVPPPPGEEGELFEVFWDRLLARLPIRCPEDAQPEAPLVKRRWLAAGSMVLLSVGLLTMLLLWRGQSVSAEEVLNRAVAGEAKRVRVLAQPVIYHKLEVERMGGPAERILLESWNDLAHQQVRQRVIDREGVRFRRRVPVGEPEVTLSRGGRVEEVGQVSLLEEVERVLAANEFDLTSPLSPESFADWRERATDRTDHVAVEETAVRLTTSIPSATHPDVIRKASFLIRRQDWHPIALSLTVGARETPTVFVIREMAYEVVPLEALTVFAEEEKAPLVEGGKSGEKERQGLALGGRFVLPSPAALRSAEVEALFALHQVRADLGEQIEITRTDRQVLVAGVVQHHGRREELLDVLRDLPLVRTEIQTLEEVLASLPLATTSAPSALPSGTPAGPTEREPNDSSAGVAGEQRPPILQRRLMDLLRAGVGGREAEPQPTARWIAQSFTAIEADASSALSEARALFHLHENYREELALPRPEPGTAPLGGGGGIDPVVRRRLEEIDRNLLFRLRQRWRSLAGRLQPVLGPLPGAEQEPRPPLPRASRHNRVSHLLQAVERSSRLTDRLLVVSDPPVFQSVAEDLLVELASIEWMLDQLEND